MKIEVIPTVIEGYDAETQDAVFKLTAFDEAAAELTISTVVSASSWPDISAAIHEALRAMKLEGDGE